MPHCLAGVVLAAATKASRFSVLAALYLTNNGRGFRFSCKCSLALLLYIGLMTQALERAT